MAKRINTYNVRYERDDTGWWVASVDGIQGCHTQGRSINQTRKRIREALSLFVDDAERAILKDDIVLPSNLSVLVEAAIETRKRLEAAQIEANNSTKIAAKALTKNAFGVRDASEVLGISYQRVHQLAPALSAGKSALGAAKGRTLKRRAATSKALSK